MKRKENRRFLKQTNGKKRKEDKGKNVNFMQD